MNTWKASYNAILDTNNCGQVYKVLYCKYYQVFTTEVLVLNPFSGAFFKEKNVVEQAFATGRYDDNCFVYKDICYGYHMYTIYMLCII